MATSQSAILPEAGSNGLFLLMNVHKETEEVLAACVGLSQLVQTLQEKFSAKDLVGSVAFGARFWQQISPKVKPEELKDFVSLGEGSLTAPATGGDVFIHIHSNRRDLCHYLANEFIQPIRQYVDVLDEVHGFRYLDERDLTGFIDGTENPEGEERAGVALIGAEDEAFQAGSYVLVQRYVHRLKQWQQLDDASQEGIIGRTKTDSVELDEDVMPETSHVSRVVIEEEGEELEIVRHSMPYGQAASEQGLFFLAYSNTISTFDKMLNNMFGMGGDDLHDHLMNFTEAKSGAYFFAPSLEVLNRLKK